MPTPLRRASRRLSVAVHLPVTLYLGYIGLGAAANPDALTRAIPDWLTYAWALALIGGALLVITGTASDRTRAESAGHGFHLFGITVYALVHLSLIGGSDIAALIVLAAVPILRMRLLRKSRAAGAEAGRILHRTRTRP